MGSRQPKAQAQEPIAASTVALNKANSAQAAAGLTEEPKPFELPSTPVSPLKPLTPLATEQMFPSDQHESPRASGLDLRAAEFHNSGLSKSKGMTKTSSVSSMSSMNSSNSLGTVHMRALLVPDSPLRVMFEEFVKSKFANESLMLFDACSEYRRVVKANLPETEKTQKLSELGRKIVANHFAKDAPYAVDVPGGLRTALVAASEKGVFAPHAFDPVYVIAFNDLKDNFFFQFLKVKGLDQDEE